MSAFIFFFLSIISTAAAWTFKVATIVGGEVQTNSTKGPILHIGSHGYSEYGEGGVFKPYYYVEIAGADSRGNPLVAPNLKHLVSRRVADLPTPVAGLVMVSGDCKKTLHRSKRVRFQCGDKKIELYKQVYFFKNTPAARATHIITPYVKKKAPAILMVELPPKDSTAWKGPVICSVAVVDDGLDVRECKREKKKLPASPAVAFTTKGMKFAAEKFRLDDKSNILVLYPKGRNKKFEQKSAGLFSNYIDIGGNTVFGPLTNQMKLTTAYYFAPQVITIVKPLRDEEGRLEGTGCLNTKASRIPDPASFEYDEFLEDETPRSSSGYFEPYGGYDGDDYYGGYDSGYDDFYDDGGWDW